MRRLVAREGISEQYAKMRIAAQRGSEYFEEHCDYVLRNDSDINTFRSECEKFFAEVLVNV